MKEEPEARTTMPNVFSRPEQNHSPQQHDQLTKWLLEFKRFNTRVIGPPVTLEEYAYSKRKGAKKKRSSKHKARSDGSDSEDESSSSKGNYVQMEVPVADGDTAIGSLKMKLYLAMVSGSTTPSNTSNLSKTRDALHASLD